MRGLSNRAFASVRQAGAKYRWCFLYLLVPLGFFKMIYEKRSKSTKCGGGRPDVLVNFAHNIAI